MRIGLIADVRPIAAAGALLAFSGCVSAPAAARGSVTADTAAGPKERASSLVLAELSPEERTEVEKLPGHSSGTTARTVGWVAMAIGGDAAVVAVVTSFVLLHKKSELNQDCVDKRCSAAGLDAAAAIDSLVPWNTASWAVAAAAIGTGAVLLLTHPSSKASHAKGAAASARALASPALALSPGPSGATLWLSGAF